MPDTPHVEPGDRPADARVTALEVVRFVVELFAILTFAFWGFASWPFPWSIVAGLAAPAAAILVWALFVSPKAVVPVHPFIRAIVELVVFAGAAVAWWHLGQPWIGVAFAVVAVVSGALVGSRRL